jgi:hypothetical protein
VKLADFKNDYYIHSGSASLVSRQISFAGIAVVWIFKSDSSEGLALPETLMIPLFLLLLSLAFDLMQYTVSAAIWGIFHRCKENEFGVGYEEEISAPSYLNWPALFFFWGKLLFLGVGYYFLAKFAACNIWFGA